MSAGINPNRRTLAAYIGGFIISLYLTLSVYFITVYHLWSKSALMFVIALAAVAQFAVQVIFFLHLGAESRPRWRLWSFAFMLMVVVILVYGSWWIMSNLNYHMTPTQVNQYLQSQDGL